jgi:hypothetical protein
MMGYGAPPFSALNPRRLAVLGVPTADAHSPNKNEKMKGNGSPLLFAWILFCAVFFF